MPLYFLRLRFLDLFPDAEFTDDFSVSADISLNKKIQETSPFSPTNLISERCVEKSFFLTLQMFGKRVDSFCKHRNLSFCITCIGFAFAKFSEDFFFRLGTELHLI